MHQSGVPNHPTVARRRSARALPGRCRPFAATPRPDTDSKTVHRSGQALRELADNAQCGQPGPGNQISICLGVLPSGLDLVTGGLRRQCVDGAGIALIGVKRKLVDHVVTPRPPMPLCRGEEPPRIRADQSDRGRPKMSQGTLNRCRRRNHGLTPFRTQFAKMRLNGLVTEKISRPCARQPNRLQREGIESIQCLSDIVKVSAQPGLRGQIRRSPYGPWHTPPLVASGPGIQSPRLGSPEVSRAPARHCARSNPHSFTASKFSFRAAPQYITHIFWRRADSGAAYADLV